MTAWIWITKTFKAIWGKLKKLPGWALALLLLLVATIWYCVGLIMKGKEIKKIQQDRILIEQERYRVVEQIRDDEDAATDKVIEKYDKEIEKLDDRSAKLQDQLAEGPVGIADAWKAYLLEKTDD